MYNILILYSNSKNLNLFQENLTTYLIKTNKEFIIDITTELSKLVDYSKYSIIFIEFSLICHKEIYYYLQRIRKPFVFFLDLNENYDIVNSIVYRPYGIIRTSNFYNDCSRIFKFVFCNSEKYLKIKEYSVSIYLRLDLIMHVESFHHYVYIHTVDGIYKTRMKLGQIESILDDDNFYRCHQSYIVNYNYVSKIDAQQIILYNNSNIPISRSRLKSTVLSFYNYKLKR